MATPQWPTCWCATARLRRRSTARPPSRRPACGSTAMRRAGSRSSTRSACAIASPMLIAARQGRADVVALLLELGMDVDVADETEQRGLHNAVAKRRHRRSPGC